jgi:CheY-like chemotaxis protein/anti-sigma regulatory factor (Ser/Thr protein kinase)
MIELLERSLGPRVTLRIDIPPGLPPASIDANQLELAILNLAINARDAMPDGGSIEISAAEAQRDRSRNGAAASYIRIEVRDTGSGMDGETIKKAIEPFFSTKPLGKGTGLGLSMVHGLAAQSDGAMRLESHVGKGTRVELWLPVSDETPTVQVPVPAALWRDERLPSRVLVVDDDPLLVASTAAILEDLGHVVIEASSGVHALDALRRGAEVDVVITDHAMPGMSGFELARRIKASWPALPIILASGYGDLPNDEDPGLPRLSKPYRQEDLVAKITEVVSGYQSTPRVRA